MCHTSLKQNEWLPHPAPFREGMATASTYHRAWLSPAASLFGKWVATSSMYCITVYYSVLYHITILYHITVSSQTLTDAHRFSQRLTQAHRGSQRLIHADSAERSSQMLIQAQRPRPHRLTEGHRGYQTLTDAHKRSQTLMCVPAHAHRLYASIYCLCFDIIRSLLRTIFPRRQPTSWRYKERKIVSMMAEAFHDHSGGDAAPRTPQVGFTEVLCVYMFLIFERFLNVVWTLEGVK